MGERQVAANSVLSGDKIMVKNIVLCSDGTGNSGGKERGTNVWKTYLAVDRHDQIPQVAFYDDGVGTSDFRLAKIMGGAVGWGLGRNIRQLYTSLARIYEPGDHIYLFGFSRGAYTVRSLSGMISEIGIIDGRALRPPSDLSKYVKKAYRAYRAEYAGRRRTEAKQRPPDARPIPRSPKAKAFRDWCWKEKVASNDAEGVFIGVWDTVDAVGLPMDWLRDVLSMLALLRRPHVDRLTPNVSHAFHALSIDDERKTFKPVMWRNADKATGAILEQVWFAGVHSNVGGGYPKQGLAAVTRYWMMNEAQNGTLDGGGLRFVLDAYQAAHNEANAHSALYDSRAGLASYYRYQVRNLESLSDGQPRVHITALDRIERATDDYAPTNVPTRVEVATTDHSLGVLARRDDYQAKLKARDRARQDLVAPIAAARVARQWIYRVFLSLSIALVGMLVTFGFDWTWGAALLGRLSEALRPALGWLNWLVVPIIRFAGGILSGVVGIALPDFLEGPVRALIKVPELVTLIALVGLALLWLRSRVTGRLRNLGINFWHDTLTAPQPPEPTEGTGSN